MIQWFPGHMKKAIIKIREIASIIDLFIVVLDARAPISSYNEEFDSIAPHKPRLFVISKIDLCDQNKINDLIKKFNNKSDKVITVNLKESSSHKKIINSAEKLLEEKRIKDIKKGILKPRLRAVVIGVPNSGKSTLINKVAKKSKVKVANTPGVTRAVSWINAGKLQLMDTPGILVPKFDNQSSAIKLVIIGSIKSSIVPNDELFYETYKLISKYYPDKIKKIGLSPSFDKIVMYSELVKLCELKKFMNSNNKSNTNKAIDYFVNYIKGLKGVTYD